MSQFPGARPQAPPGAFPPQQGQQPVLRTGQMGTAPGLSGHGGQMGMAPSQSQWSSNRASGGTHTNTLQQVPGRGPPIPGQQQQMPGRGPPVSGQQQQMPGRGPPMPGQQQQMPGRGPPMPGQQQQMPGRGPPIPGQQPQIPGRGPPMPGQQQQMPGRGPPMPGQQQQMPGRGPPMPGQQQQMPGRGPPMPGQQQQMPGRGPPMPGQQQQMPGRGPPIPGQQQQMPGRGPPMPGQQQQMPGRGPPIPGQQPQIPGRGPPMPGQPPPPMPNAGAPIPQQAAHQKARIDPKQIPRPKYFSNVIQYHSNSSSGNVVPSVHQPFLAFDEGNSTPRFIRMTVNAVPTTADMQATSCLPLAALIQPFADQAMEEGQVPQVNSGDAGPARCTRCRGYVNSFVTFADNNSKWICNLCGNSNDATGSLLGTESMYGGSMPAELARGTVDFIVSGAYMIRPPQESIQVFLLDITPKSILSGTAIAIIDNLRSSLEKLASLYSFSRIGVVAFDSSSLYYYDNLAEDKDTKVLVVNDIEDAYSPLPPNTWLIQMNDTGKNRLLSLLDFIKEQVKREHSALTNEERSSQQPHPVAAGNAPVGQLQQLARQHGCVGACIKGAMEGLKQVGGKMTAFFTQMPTHGQGTMSETEHVREYGTKNEAKMYSADPKNSFYSELATECAEHYVSVDLFCLNSGYCGLATMGQLCHATGGALYHLPEVSTANPTIHARLGTLLERNLMRDSALEAVLKVRCSAGLRVMEYLGAGLKRVRGGELDVARFDADQSCAVMLEHDGSVQGDAAYIQCAVLHTTLDGKRAVRVINRKLNVTTDLGEVYRSADMDAMANLMARQSARELINEDRSSSAMKLEEIRKSITRACVEVLFAYRVHCATPSSAGQLILPESLKLLPLMCLCVIKSDLLRINGPPTASRTSREMVDVLAEDRVIAMHIAETWSVEKYTKFVYPKLYHIDQTEVDLSQQAIDILEFSRSPTAESLSIREAFVMDDGLNLMLFVGQDFPTEIREQIIRPIPGTLDFVCAPTAHPFAAKLVTILQKLRPSMHPNSIIASVQVIVPKGPREKGFLNKLVEDKLEHETSYISYLVQVHKEIQAKLANQ